MTITEKILARAAGRERVVPGEIVQAELDWIMTNDATTHVSIDIFESKLRGAAVRCPDRVIWVVDHNVPAESVETANVQKKQREFAEKHGFRIHNGEGVCHQILVERYVRPGQVVIGADSHTCSHGALGAFATGVGSTDLVAAMTEGALWFMVPPTLRFELEGSIPPGVTTKDLVLRITGDISARGATYKAMEYAGPGLRSLSLDSRIALANLAVEAGAKSAIMEVDDTLRAFLRRARDGDGAGQEFRSDPDATYERVHRYRLDDVEPVVAFPHTVDNVRPIGEALGLRLDQVFIGSCSNGRLEDLRIVAETLRGRRIAKNVRLAIAPASRQVYLAALAAGYVTTFLEAGAMVLNPNCSTCWGGCQAVAGDGERLLSTGTRNFKGRSGSASAEVYLGSVFTAVASALAGEIVDPRRYLGLA
jgi:3-isopropylmalate/(R)-2-methylmalate dehydratase large subunit